jgi:hypothetical protein
MTEKSPHAIRVPRTVFTELRSGNPILICKDLGQLAGDLVLVYEDDNRLETTDRFALLKITWVVRASARQGQPQANGIYSEPRPGPCEGAPRKTCCVQKGAADVGRNRRATVFGKNPRDTKEPPARRPRRLDREKTQSHEVY